MNDEHKPLDDEARLAAWLDGELDKDGDADMTKLVASDDALNMRAYRVRHLDDLVRRAIPDEEIPAQLLERLGLADATANASVVNLAEVRDAKRSLTATQHRMKTPMFFSKLAAQIVLVAGLGTAVALWQNPATQSDDNAAYRVLSDIARPAPANGVVIFADGIDHTAAKAIARSVGVKLVGVPNEAGAWKLALPAGKRDSLLAELRADSRVTMAEPIDGQQP